jgi:drug/metabolite transporter (DMT)-like permease
VALIGALALAAAVVLLLVDPIGLAPWLAALLVGVVLGAIGYVMLQKGLRDLKGIDPTPRRTVAGLKEDIQLAREARP